MAKKEIKVEDLVKEIMDQAKVAYKEFQKTNDRESFGTRLNGIYRSYYRTDNPLYPQAMLEVLKSKPKTNEEAEIIVGNNGFRVCAQNASEVAKNEIVTIYETLGIEAAKCYIKGMSVCDLLMIARDVQYTKDLDAFIKGVVEIATATNMNKR